MSLPPANPSLLPSGFYDLLPRQAGLKYHAIFSMLDQFISRGFEPVIPPTIEYEDSLFHAQGKSQLHRCFRMMDPISHKMMGLRSDMTLQVARIAQSRLGSHPSPLRLCYTGDVFRVYPDGSTHNRQLTQLGIECIDSDHYVADLDIVMTITDALHAIGLTDLTLDFNLPALTSYLISTLGDTSETRQRLLSALQTKDSDTIRGLNSAYANTLIALTLPSSSVESLRSHLNAFQLDATWNSLIDTLEHFVTMLQSLRPNLDISIDLLENRGFEYHTGISFSLFSKHHQHEVGRGGRYTIDTTERPIQAVGATIFVEEILDLMASKQGKKKLLVPVSLPKEALETYHHQGYITMTATTSEHPTRDEAKRLGADAIVLADGRLQEC